MTRIHAKTTRQELGAIVCEALAADLGDRPVLVGGAAVAIYTDGRYRSDDLDIVTYRENKRLRPLMKKLGFVEKGSHWTHPETELLVQFLAPPAMIGEKYVREPARMQTSAGELPIVSALDSACDRLAWFLSDSDPQSLEQCVDIIVMQKVSLAAIAKWLQSEPWPERKKAEAMKTLKRRLGARRRPAKRR